MLVVDAEVRDGSVVRQQVEVTTLRRLRWRAVGPALRRVLTGPFTEVRAHRSLIRSMVRREILARYRGSLGDVSWTILHPALMMLTYFFVFGVVLQSRFGNDPSRSGFALYFLAGMIPWLAFAEPVARAPHTVLEHRSFVKKLVFPVGILPVNLVVSGCFTGLVALLLFLPAVALLRGGLPWTALALPVLVIPQILFTLGLCWMLAATGVLLRDLTQIIGFVLTLWFFLTPICYPETSLPLSLIPVLAQNPMFQVVRGYRQVLLEGVLPSPVMLVKLWALCIVVFFAGYAWFARWRRSFPDIV